MSEDLYRSRLLNAARDTTYLGLPADATHVGDVHRRSCGDEIQFGCTVTSPEGRIDRVGFHAEACAVCRASAHIASIVVVGRRLAEIPSIAQIVIAAIADGSVGQLASVSEELAPLSSVASYPSRVACAQLPWYALADLSTSKSHISEMTDA